MEQIDAPPVKLLLVESAPTLRAALLSLFAQEGYAARGVSTLEDALTELERQPYDVILADLFVGIAKSAFTPAHILRRRAQATPLGLITSQKRVLEAPHLLGFAFALSMPIEMPLLLTEIAACLNQPLSQQEQRQAQAIERFIQAWGHQEWKSLLRLCTEEIIAYPSSLLPYTAAIPVQGKLALLGEVMKLRRCYHRFRIEIQGVYRRPHGLAVHYRGCVASFGKSWVLFSGAALFQFAGERISQMGMPLDDPRWAGLRELPPTSLGLG